MSIRLRTTTSTSQHFLYLPLLKPYRFTVYFSVDNAVLWSDGAGGAQLPLTGTHTMLIQPNRGVKNNTAIFYSTQDTAYIPLHAQENPFTEAIHAVYPSAPVSYAYYYPADNKVEVGVFTSTYGIGTINLGDNASAMSELFGTYYRFTEVVE